MMDMQANLEKLRANAAEAVLIRDSATDNSKRVSCTPDYRSISGNSRDRG